ncbi:GLIPR1-like protein 1 [Littorina saxatilis]|uniref:SCP domain-containing protein n=1 Tax=Littorina saxatilis TaxID=31220 RepID=A0AAN9GMH4_9CAEN
MTGEVTQTLLVGAVLCLVVSVQISSASDETEQDDASLVAVSVSGVLKDHSQHLTRRYANERVRRQAPTNRDKLGFNEEEKRILVEKHNALRRLEGSSEMKYMFWDDDLEALAQDWAANCVFSHRPDRKNIGSFSYAGENLYAGTGGYDPDNVVQLWYDEKKYYNFNTKACSHVCGHYTQVVWASSYAVGCGVAYCPVLKKVSFGQGWHVACNYGPGGNYVGQRPYKKGDACSQCDDDAIFCVDGLCSKYPVIETDSGSSRDHPVFSLIGSLLICGLWFCSW